MTLESTINKNRYIGNGATTQFPFTFKIWKTDQILVYVGDGLTEQEVSAQCSIEITASGGNVTFPTAPASGTIIVLRRKMPYIQEDDYRNGTRFDSEEIEDRFDMDCAERQDLRTDVDRAVKVHHTSDKTPEEYAQDFWTAHDESIAARDSIEQALNELGTEVATHSYVLATDTTHARTLGERFADIINVKDFGARGDGVTDDTLAIQTALDEAERSGKICFATGTYKIVDTIIINCSCEMGTAKFNIDGSAITPAVKIGKTGAGSVPGNILRRAKIVLPEIINTAKPDNVFGWDDLTSSIGVQMLNAMECEVTVTNIKHFYIGLYLTAAGSGCAYNTFNVQCLWNNHTNLYIHSHENTSWVTQNTFIGERFFIDDGEGVASEPVQIRIDHDEPGFGPNNNTFINCCLEGSVVKYNIRCNGSYNMFLNCRFERSYNVLFETTSGTATTKSLTCYNMIIGGFNVYALNITKSQVENSIIDYNMVMSSGGLKGKCFGGFFNAFGNYQYAGHHIAGYSPNDDVLEKSSTDTDWLWMCDRTGVSAKVSSSYEYFQTKISDGLYLGDGSSNSDYKITASNNYKRVVLSGTGLEAFAPGQTGTDLGTTYFPWDNVYANSGPWSGSDVRLKSNIETPSESMLAAWGKIRFKIFQMNDALNKKGDKARVHVGLIAQEVEEAFASEGLDVRRYGLFGYDEWDDEYIDEIVVDQEQVLNEQGEEVQPHIEHVEKKLIKKAGNQYSIRYEEALALECAYQRWRLEQLEERVNQLTNNSNK